MFIGVDACKGGWVAIEIDNKRFVTAGRFGTFAEVMERFRKARVIAVDMPIGLVARGDRDADGEARDFVEGRHSTVFNAPARSVLEAKSYKRACRLSRSASKKAIAQQTFGLIPRIREVDAFIGDRRVHEVHPEVSFKLMNGKIALEHSKHRWAGMRQRLALLERAGIKVPADLGDASVAGVDDILDAGAAAWSARRIARGEAMQFGEKGKQSGRSRPIAIWG